MKRLLILASTAILASLGLMLAQCGDDGGIHGGDGYEVHEWGVVIVTDGDSNGIVTSRPEQGSPVREPVIYFHGGGPGPIAVKATFHAGWPSLAYPLGLIGKSTVEWDSVWVLSMIPEEAPASEQYETLDSILGVLGDVDAQRLQYRDTLSQFLFYEGYLQFRNQISATWDLDSLMVHLTNHSSAPVYNLTVSISPQTSQDSAHPVTYMSRVARLLPGATADQLLVTRATYDFNTDLVSVGFSRSEAVAFDNIWRSSFLDPYHDSVHANLSYRVTQGTYDSLISLEVTPIPDRTIRTLYALVHIR
jgi:hypothetical protein